MFTKKEIKGTESESFFDRVPREMVDGILNWLLRGYSDYHASAAYVAGGLQFAAQFGNIPHRDWADFRQTVSYVQFALTASTGEMEKEQADTLRDILKHWPSVAAAVSSIKESSKTDG